MPSYPFPLFEAVEISPMMAFMLQQRRFRGYN